MIFSDAAGTEICVLCVSRDTATGGADLAATVNNGFAGAGGNGGGTGISRVEDNVEGGNAGVVSANGTDDGTNLAGWFSCPVVADCASSGCDGCDTGITTIAAECSCVLVIHKVVAIATTTTAPATPYQTARNGARGDADCISLVDARGVCIPGN